MIIGYVGKKCRKPKNLYTTIELLSSMSMKMYNSVEQLSDASVNALKQYQNLMSGSAVILFLAAEKKNADKQQQTMKIIAENIGIASQESKVQLKEMADGIYQKVQEYRQSSPEYVVEMLDEGLGFLEKLCEKYK
jgi:hypothetical protein